MSTFRPQALDELLAISDALVPDLIEEFKSTGPEIIALILAHQARAEFKDVQLHAHSLKSSSRLLGFDQLGEACSEIEQAAKINQTKPELASRLTPLLKEALTAIEAFMKNR